MKYVFRDLIISRYYFLFTPQYHNGHHHLMRTLLAVLFTSFPPYIPLPKQTMQTYPHPPTFDKGGTRFFPPPHLCTHYFNVRLHTQRFIRVRTPSPALQIYSRSSQHFPKNELMEILFLLTCRSKVDGISCSLRLRSL